MSVIACLGHVHCSRRYLPRSVLAVWASWGAAASGLFPRGAWFWECPLRADGSRFSPRPPTPARRGPCAAVRAEPGPRQGPDTSPPTSAAGASRRCARGQGGCRVGSKGCRWGGRQRGGGGASCPPPAGCGAARQGLRPRRRSARRDTEPEP